jgi:hypothetical protein
MTSAESPTVKFFYIKTPLFRVIHSDGVVGGLTPRGYIHVAFYSERGAIPQTQTHTISPEGRLLDPFETEGKDGIVREMDVDVILAKQAAIDLRDWLSSRIVELEKLEQGNQS